MSKTAHIIIAEPSAIIREGLRCLLENSGIVCRLTSAQTLEEVQAAHLRKHAHLVLVNPALTQYNLKSLQHLRQQIPSVPFLALVYCFFDPSVLQYFDDSIGISESAETLNQKISHYLRSERENNQDQENLSERETEVLTWIAHGHSNKEIADRLHISVNTVVSHRKNISQKTGIKSVSGLTIYAVVKNLIPLPPDFPPRNNPTRSA